VNVDRGAARRRISQPTRDMCGSSLCDSSYPGCLRSRLVPLSGDGETSNLSANAGHVWVIVHLCLHLVSTALHVCTSWPNGILPRSTRYDNARPLATGLKKKKEKAKVAVTKRTRSHRRGRSPSQPLPPKSTTIPPLPCFCSTPGKGSPGKYIGCLLASLVQRSLSSLG
jgi:hypothetical protein